MDRVLPDPVVGVAGQHPVAHRGRERDRLAVVGEVPLSRTEGSRDRRPAAAAAAVHDRSEFERDVQHPRLKRFGDEVDEAVLDAVETAHGQSSFTMWLPSIW